MLLLRPVRRRPLRTPLRPAPRAPTVPNGRQRPLTVTARGRPRAAMPTTARRAAAAGVPPPFLCPSLPPSRRPRRRRGGCRAPGCALTSPGRGGAAGRRGRAGAPQHGCWRGPARRSRWSPRGVAEPPACPHGAGHAGSCSPREAAAVPRWQGGTGRREGEAAPAPAAAWLAPVAPFRELWPQGRGFVRSSSLLLKVFLFCPHSIQNFRTD